LSALCRSSKPINKKKHEEKYRIANQLDWSQRPHRRWAVDTLRHHRKKYTIELSVDELTGIAKKVDYCPLCKTKLLWGKKPNSRIVLNSPSLDRMNNEKSITAENFMILCYSCNTTKGARSLQEFRNYCQLILNNLTNQT